MSARADMIREAYRRLDEGSVDGFVVVFADGARWLGVSGGGIDGHTPT